MTYFNSPRMTHFPKMEYFNLWAQQILISGKLNYFNFDTSPENATSQSLENDIFKPTENWVIFPKLK